MNCSTPSRRGTITRWRRNWVICSCRWSSTASWPANAARLISSRSLGASRTNFCAAIPTFSAEVKVKNVEEVWANWEKIKTAEKHGTPHARTSALDGIPKHLPALMRAEKLLKKARKARLLQPAKGPPVTKGALARRLFTLARQAQARGWSPEDLLRREIGRQERALRRRERRPPKVGYASVPHAHSPPSAGDNG